MLLGAMLLGAMLLGVLAMDLLQRRPTCYRIKH